MVGINNFLCVVNDDNKAGDNLEYDDAYLAMESLATNEVGSMSASDEDIGKQADYKALLKTTTSLLERTRDFRVAVFHTIALTATQGFKGLKDSLLLLGFISVELWDEAYPQLDPDDDLDPTERLNILSTISPDSVNDPFGFFNVLNNRPCCPPLSLTNRDIKIARGILKVDSDVDLALLKGQILSLPENVYVNNYKLIDDCLQDVGNLERVVNSKISDGYLSLEKLRNELRFILRFFDEARGCPYSETAEQSVEETEPSTANQEANADALVDDLIPPPVVATNLGENTVSLASYMQLQNQFQLLQSKLNAPAQPAKLTVSSLTIESRKDALELIEKCRAYFQKKEPTSPVPFLLRRALNMADMDFIQLLGEIDSSALERGREQLGVKNTESDSY